MRTLRSSRAAWLVATATLAVVLAFTVRRFDVTRLASAFRGTSALWLCAAGVCFFAKLPLWAVQLHRLSAPSARNRLREMFGVASVASTVHTTTWLLAGEATTVVLLVSRVGLSRAEAVSVLAMDQAMVGFAKVVILCAAAMMAPLPEPLRRAIPATIVAVILLCTLLGWMARQHADLSARIAPHAPRVERLLTSFGRGLAPLREQRRVAGVAARALLKKLCEIAAILCVQRAFGVELPVSSAIMVLAALDLATLIPVVPGNLGVYEGAVVWTYTRLGVVPEVALAMAVAQHAAYVVAAALPGYLWLLASGPFRRAAAVA
ncbi:MAG: flippase-like domain-containing protein [Gemmatimonadaceae bacterium]|nr:flippase-like domain-containing protein [Gemmatimonadaceae bacterium]